MKYKLIAVDLDGTLYNDQLKITSDTLNTMIKAQEMGIRIALASGRPLPGLFHARDLLKLNEHHGMLVAYNGGKVVDTTTNEVLYDKYIPDDLAMELLEHLKDYPVNPIIDDGKVLYVTDKNGYRVKEEALNDSMEYVEVPSLTEHLDFHLNKILTAVDPQKTYDVLETIGMPFRDQVTFVRTAPYYIEAIPVGTSKASGLSNVFSAEIWDLLERTPVGVGDEIQLTDAIDMLIEKEIVEAFHMTGRSFDCGDKIGYMEAFVEYGLRHDKLGKEFKAFLKDLAKTL